MESIGKSMIRNRNPPRIFTPSKVYTPSKTPVQTRTYNPSKPSVLARRYNLNAERAVEKIHEATARSDVTCELKGGNLILEFSSAAFLHFNSTFDKHFQNNANFSLTPHIRTDRGGNTVERSISVSAAHEHRKQLYRVNIYQTTCRVEVNGKHLELFIQELYHIIEEMEIKNGYSRLNTLIKEQCEQLLRNRRFIVQENQDELDDKVDIKCPKCNKNCLRRAVVCSKGKHWVHYRCERLKDHEIEKLEDKKEKISYICSQCSSSDILPIQTLATECVNKSPYYCTKN